MRRKDDFENQKLRLLILLRILHEETDRAHGYTLTELRDRLAGHGVDLEEKSVSESLSQLQKAGFTISRKRVKNATYFAMTERDFSLAEVKLLAASVQSSRYLTDKQVRELTNKLKGLVSLHEAGSIYTGMQAYGRVRTTNESVYSTIDVLNEAVESRRKIRFRYFAWDMHKKKAYRNGGAPYSASPYLIVSANDKVYMFAYDEADEKVKNFRVDKMEDIELLEEPATLTDHPSLCTPSVFIAGMFNMYGGESLTSVKLRCSESIANVIVDTFGRDRIMVPQGDGTFTIEVDVYPSKQFYGWIIGLHPDVQMVAPAAEVQKLETFVEGLRASYGEKIQTILQ